MRWKLWRRIEVIEEMDGMEELGRNPLCPPDITSGGKENPPSLPPFVKGE